MMESITKIIVKSVINMWPMLVIFSVILTCLRIAMLISNNEKFVFHKEFSNLLFLIYILLLYELLTRTELNKASGYNLVPFTEIFRYKIGSNSFYFSVIGNIVIFIPFGYFISKFIKPNKILPVFIVSAISSATIEFVQVGIGRSFDVDDIILNVVGSIIGFLIYVSFKAIKKYLPGIFQKDLIYNLISLIILILIVIWIIGRLGVNIV